jgi:hypothetical protein
MKFAIRLPVVAMIVVCTASAIAQSAAHIARSPDCSQCAISLRRLGFLGGGPDAGGGIPAQIHSIDRDSLGRLWVSFYGSHPPLIYDSTGRELASVARLGQGPGEVSAGSVAISTHTDSMLVLDFRNGRTNVYGSTGAFVGSRTASIHSGGAAYLASRDGRIVMSGTLPSRDGAGFPLHVFKATGEWQTSFGADIAVMRGSSGVPRLAVAASANGGFWALNPLQYRLVRWSLDGQKTLEVVRRADWFIPSTTSRNPDPASPPQTRARAIAEDVNQRVWVLVNVPDRRWRDSFGTPQALRGPDEMTQRRTRTPLADMRKYLDTIIEVYEIGSTPRLLVSWRTDDAIFSILRNGLLIGAEGDGTEITLFRAELSVPQTRR